MISKNLPNKTRVRVGTAGWSIPANIRPEFPIAGSALERYATRFNAVEINSSFYRPHKHSTYENWASQVAEDFAFSVKLPRNISHHSRLRDIQEPLKRFAAEGSGLGCKLGCVLVQLPPSLAFFKPTTVMAFDLLRQAFACSIVCEPRHRSWFSCEVGEVFTNAAIARAAADPAICVPASVPGGDTDTCYYRLHGTPDIYYSDYGAKDIENYARSINEVKQTSEVWCIFDNTADGRAISNALSMQQQTAA